MQRGAKGSEGVGLKGIRLEGNDLVRIWRCDVGHARVPRQAGEARAQCVTVLCVGGGSESLKKPRLSFMRYVKRCEIKELVGACRQPRRKPAAVLDLECRGNVQESHRAGGRTV